MAVHVKRVYDARSSDDGFRVLVDRLWPRGVSQEAAQVHLWLRDIAPSTALRRWFGHRAERWPEFRARYHVELASHPDLLDLLGDIERHRGRLTLLYGARDPERNEAGVLAETLGGWPRHSHH